MIMLAQMGQGSTTTTAGGIALLGTMVTAAGIDAALTLATIVAPDVEETHGLALYTATLVCEALVIVTSLVAVRRNVASKVGMSQDLLFLVVSSICTVLVFASSVWSLQCARRRAHRQGVHPAANLGPAASPDSEAAASFGSNAAASPDSEAAASFGSKAAASPASEATARSEPDAAASCSVWAPEAAGSPEPESAASSASDAEPALI